MKIGHKTAEYIGYEIGMINGQPGMRKSGEKIIRFLEFASNIKTFEEVATIMYKIRFLSNSLHLHKYWFQLRDILKGMPISLKELKKIKVPNDIAKKVEVIAHEATQLTKVDLLTFRGFNPKLFTAIICDASKHSLVALLGQFPEEDFHKDPFDKDFIVLDVIHHTFNDVEVERHISVKELMAVHMTLTKHREEIYVSRKPILAFTDNQGNQLRFDTLKITQKGTALQKNARMAIVIVEAGIVLSHVPGIYNMLADELSRKNVERIEAPVWSKEDLNQNDKAKADLLTISTRSHRLKNNVFLSRYFRMQ